MKIFKQIILYFGTLGLISCTSPVVPTEVVKKSDETYSPSAVRPVLEKWQHNTFKYFYDGASPTGMALEGNNRGDGGVVTIGGGGFGVMALIVGSERGWITREQSAEQVQKIVRFLGKAERFKGVWSHWYKPDGTSQPFGNQVQTGDLVETSFMMAGLLTAGEYFTDSNGVEQEIRDSVSSFWNTIDWRFYTANQQVLKWLWYSQTNQFELNIAGWNESLITYLLALAAPEPHNISADVYKQGWQRGGSMFFPTRQNYGYNLKMGENLGGPLFFSHYSFLGLDAKKMEDNDVNFWQQNTAHTLINRHYCIEEAPDSYKYDEQNWGLTACYGSKPPEYNYLARSPLQDDGVIAPTAALSSFPYTPFYSTQVLLNLNEMPLVHSTYGIADSYCPSTNTSEKKHLAIDQGPIVVMIENYRSGLIWNLLMKNAHIKNALNKAGIRLPAYEPGFTRVMTNQVTKEYDMMRHPDREKFEIDYFVKKGENVNFKLTDSDNKIIFEQNVQASSGENLFSFDDKAILKGKAYTLTMTTADSKNHSLKVRLR